MSSKRKVSSNAELQDVPEANGFDHHPGKRTDAPHTTPAANVWLSQDAVKLLVCTGSGIVFGFAAEKAKGRPEHNS